MDAEKKSYLKVRELIDFKDKYKLTWKGVSEKTGCGERRIYYYRTGRPIPASFALLIGYMMEFGIDKIKLGKKTKSKN